MKKQDDHYRKNNRNEMSDNMNNNVKLVTEIIEKATKKEHGPVKKLILHNK